MDYRQIGSRKILRISQRQRNRVHIKKRNTVYSSFRLEDLDFDVFRNLDFRINFAEMYRKVLALSLALLVLLPLRVESLICTRCEREKCTEPANCEFGIAKDICGCCNVCAKGLGDDCGGVWNIAGECGKGLRCEANPRDWQEPGKCVPGR